MKELKKRLKPFLKIVERIDSFTYSGEENISRLKAKIGLFDGTYLWIWEKSDFDVLVSYSYYWFHRTEKLIIGWDNAPYHSEIETYPHHKHINGKIELSDERNLTDILRYISSIYFENEN